MILEPWFKLDQSTDTGHQLFTAGADWKTSVWIGPINSFC